MNKKMIMTMMILVLSVFFVACAPTNRIVDNNNPATGNVNLAGIGDSDKLIRFNNSDEFKDFMENRLVQSSYNGYSSLGGLRTSSVMESSGAMVKSADSATAQAPTASDYSQTNIQVEGVDEADIVKNDDRYIYMISANKLLIVDAYDAANAKIISETRLEEEAVKKDSTATSSKVAGMMIPDYYYDNTVTAKELFLNEDKLVVFAEKNERTYYFEKYDITPRTSYKQVTQIHIYDITDKSAPKLVEKFKTNGNYYQSRMIGNTVYMISQDYINNYPIIMPYVRSEVSTKIASPEIYYFDNDEQNYVLNTITSFDIKNNEVIESKSIAMGYANSLMMSENNIYIAYQKQRYWARCLSWSCPVYSGYQKERFYDVVVPLLENDLKVDIEKIIAEETDDDLEWKKISERLEIFYTDLEDNEVLQTKYADMLKKIENAITDYDVKQELENSKTIIHKFSINQGLIDYKAQGEVYGTLLNQFSFDEFEGDLRLATTVNVWTQNEQVQHNNVYVLDENMKIKGELKGIAEKERIYSSRFIGDKLYLVTYRQMDPFFVIDLSDTSNPKVLGELKIPGYSDYLHPFDETHIIGIGKETGENEWGGISSKGLKIALFDVSDFSNPKLVDEVLIGEQGTDSPALHDHKAFLFSKTNGLMVLPVSEVVERKRYNSQYGGYSYSYTTWYGAYAFNVTAKGFDQIGKVEHSKLSQGYYDWWSVSAVLRSLYMDNKLYTISNKYLKINDLNDGLKELNSISLPQIDSGYPTPLIDYGVVESVVSIK